MVSPKECEWSTAASSSARDKLRQVAGYGADCQGESPACLFERDGSKNTYSVLSHAPALQAPQVTCVYLGFDLFSLEGDCRTDPPSYGSITAQALAAVFPVAAVAGSFLAGTYKAQIYSC